MCSTQFLSTEHTKINVMSLQFDFLHYVTKTKHSKTMAFQTLVQSLPSLGGGGPIIQTQ